MATTSFLPQDYVEKKIQQRTNVICLALFCIVLSVVTLAWWVTNREQIEDQKLKQDVDRQFVEADHRLQQLDEMQQRRSEMMLKARVTSALLERVPRTLILSELINNMPTSMGLLELGISTHVVAARTPPTNLMDKAKLERNKGLTGMSDIDIKPTEVGLDVVGMAPTDVQVAQFMTALGKSPIFQDLTLQYTEDMVVDSEHMRKFGINMTINQDIDMKTIEPRMVKREDLPKDPMGGQLQVEKDGKIVPIGPAAPKVFMVPAASH